jgi:hypothetical protein
MTLSKPVKILVGIMTIWYTLYLFLTTVGIVLLFVYVFVALFTGGEAVASLG